MGTFIRSAAALAALLSLASPLFAQGALPGVLGTMAGNMAAAREREQCLSGKAPAARRLDMARSRSETAMRDYLRLAAATPADARAAFTKKMKMRAWSSGGQTGQIEAVDDPVARALAAGGAALPEPRAFILSGDQASALGVWMAPGAGPGAAPLGHYRVSFRPEGPYLPEGGQIWRITSLELVQGPADPVLPSQYCSTAGDVEEHAVELARFKEEQERKKAEKAASRAAPGGS
jgi:hypothetical protein